MKKLALIIAVILISSAVSAQEKATVYMTTDITPEALVGIYEALGVKAEGNVAVKSVQENQAVTISYSLHSSASW